MSYGVARHIRGKRVIRGLNIKQPNCLLASFETIDLVWYRQSIRYPASVNVDEDLSVFRRETLEPGMQAVLLDSEGRLLEFYARAQNDRPQNATLSPFEWHQLFTVAGLDLGRFQESRPELTPTTPFDAQMAWTGNGRDSTNGSLRVEAAAFRGQPVMFRVLGPWAQPSEPVPLSLGPLSLPLFVVSVIVMPLVGGVLAWRNSRSGHGDRRGAFRLAAFAFICMLLQDLVGGHHIPTSTEFLFLFGKLRDALAVAGLFWILYMALEPQVRRRRPEALISWSRVLSGRIRDRTAGGHLLIGITLGVSFLCVSQIFLTPAFETATLSGSRTQLPSSTNMVFAVWLWHAIVGVAGGLIYMFALSLVSMAVRRKWLALSIFVLLFALVLTPYAVHPVLALGRSIVFFGMVAIALSRFGVLAAAATVYAQVTLLEFPLTTNWSAWYAQSSLVALCTLLALAFYGMVTTMSHPRLAGASELPKAGEKSLTDSRFQSAGRF